MDLISVLIGLVIVGVLLWLVETFIPIAPPIKRLIEVVLVLVLVIWLLRVFGVIAHVPVRP